MTDNQERWSFKVTGMTCTSCERRIEKTLRSVEGVVEAKASYTDERVHLTHTPDLNKARVFEAVNALGYLASETEDVPALSRFSVQQWLGMGILLFALYFIINSTVGFNFIPQVDASMGLGMLFVVGLLTSLHCVAMCGGINLSQCINHAATGEQGNARFTPSLLYNAGRVVSYTVIGGLAGALGSVVSFSGGAKAGVTIFAGVFMIIMGVNMLNIFPWLRRINLRMPKFIVDRTSSAAGRRGPFVVGLLNGFMPCGPLQTMQLYALGTGSFLMGAASMFLFSLGTVPLMFGFGALSTLISQKFTHRMMKVSAVLVVVLGLTMVGRGFSLFGITIPTPSRASGSNVAKVINGIQEVTTTLESGRYQPIVVQKGIPVRWTINVKADDLNGCNNPITIPKYNLEKRLVPGENIIEFTPKDEGTITYTCWMGMISSTIQVVSDLKKAPKSTPSQDNNGGLAGGCCSAGSKATRFYGGRIPADDMLIAPLVNGVHEVTITVNDKGFSPAAVVLQRGAKVRIKFNPEKLNYCNKVVEFPEYQGGLDLGKGQLKTPLIPVTQDFTFRCWMGMQNGYVKVVDDIQKVDLSAIKKELKNYKPAGGGGCCG